ncbi:hypothetical protein BGZ76_004068 [Entomortierella beljakovae]|nr:hypothetical protein BGZ76_004068 [Entomortierella beljakovae]
MPAANRQRRSIPVTNSGMPIGQKRHLVRTRMKYSIPQEMFIGQQILDNKFNLFSSNRTASKRSVIDHITRKFNQQFNIQYQSKRIGCKISNMQNVWRSANKNLESYLLSGTPQHVIKERILAQCSYYYLLDGIWLKSETGRVEDNQNSLSDSTHRHPNTLDARGDVGDDDDYNDEDEPLVKMRDKRLSQNLAAQSSGGQAQGSSSTRYPPRQTRLKKRMSQQESSNSTLASTSEEIPAIEARAYGNGTPMHDSLRLALAKEITRQEEQKTAREKEKTAQEMQRTKQAEEKTKQHLATVKRKKYSAQKKKEEANLFQLRFQLDPRRYVNPTDSGVYSDYS